eukprot:g12125.t2
MTLGDGPLGRPQTLVDPKSFGAPAEVNEATGIPKQLQAFMIMEEPRITVVPNFFSEAECRHLRSLVEASWIPSLVSDAQGRTEQDYERGKLENMLAQTRRFGASITRTSWSCMMRYAQDSVVERLEHRLVSIGGMPMENLERMNAVRYAPGEYFSAHHDGKFRPLTVFVYLNDLEEEDDAGDTYFPFLGLSFRPRQGTALIWPNSCDGREDDRVLHAGRSPKLSVKYGVNCFFNINEMRHMMPHPKEPGFGCEPGRADVRQLGRDNGGKLVAYQLCSYPKLVAVKRFLNDEEVEHFLALLDKDSQGKTMPSGPFRRGTQTLRIIDFEETEVVKEVEERLVATGGASASQPPGLCNRGCGPKSAFICLSESDEVFFYRLGLRLKLQKGDALLWPNVHWRGDDPIEALRRTMWRSLTLVVGAVAVIGGVYYEPAPFVHLLWTLQILPSLAFRWNDPSPGKVEPFYFPRLASAEGLKQVLGWQPLADDVFIVTFQRVELTF